MALNIAARLDQAEAPGNYREVPVENYELLLVEEAPGGAIGTRSPMTTALLLVRETEQQINADNLDRLRNWSLLAVVGLAVASGIGGYVLSGMMLRPVRHITEVASEISAASLGRRINHEGPDDELKTLADTFDSMIGRLETSFERQRQFVQDASHELRTPLTAIRTNIEVAEMEGELPGEEYRGLLETIKGQTERLTRLSEDLLLLSGQDDGDIGTEPEDVAALAHEVVRQLGPVAAARGVTLAARGEAGLEAMANADSLYRCLLNLCDNAIKYSGAGSAVTVRTGRRGDRVTMAVADNGPGIEAADLARIFDRFYRIDRGRSRGEGGNGLGLAIVKELIEAQNGRVEVDSAPGTGSTFTLVLAGAPADSAEAPGALHMTPPAAV